MRISWSMSELYKTPVICASGLSGLWRPHTTVQASRRADAHAGLFF
jgi:hypothetical protein